MVPLSSTCLIERPTVGYRGPDSEALARRWNGPDRPFVLRPWDVIEANPNPQADCVVLEAAADRDVVPWIDAVHDRIGSVPVIVLNRGTVSDLATALPAGASSQLTVPADVDRIELLAELATLIDDLVTSAHEQSILASLLEGVSVSLYAKDRAGRHVAVSDAMLGLVGLPHIENPEGKRHHHPADLLGKTDFDLYADDLAAESTEDDRAVVESGEPVEERIEPSYGETGTGTDVATTKVPWYDQRGEIAGVVGVTRDISERRQYEQQLKRQNDRLRRLATMVSHDIRNPLSVAVGRLERARAAGPAEHFDAIERALDRIDALIADIITVMRHGEPVTDFEALSLETIVSDVWADQQQPGATLEVTTDAQIYADPARLRLLFEQLFENALKHGREADEPITVTVGDPPDYDGFFVADDGVGIPAADRDGIFDPGLSGSDTSTLGLALVATIADAHSWTIDLTESDESGARFEFTGVRRFDAAASTGL